MVGKTKENGAFACNIHKTQKSEYKAACTSSPIKTSLDELYRKPSTFQGKYVVVEGYYLEGFEMSALSRGRKISNPGKSIWVNFSLDIKLKNTSNNKSLLESTDEFKKIINQKIRIVGVFDSNHKGHLDEYMGEIREICSVTIL